MKNVKTGLYLLTLSIFTTLATGCYQTFTPVSDNQAANVAFIKNTIKTVEEGQLAGFYIVEVQGQRVNNIPLQQYFDKTHESSANIAVSAQPITLTIKGMNTFENDNLVLSSQVHEVTGTVSFIPQKNKNYVVYGKLDSDYSAVWIEDSETGEIIDEKVIQKKEPVFFF